MTLLSPDNIATVQLASINCGSCGGAYAISERYRKEKHDTGGSWHCPYCQCGWGYSGNSENERLKRQLEQQAAVTERERNWRKSAEADRDSERNRRIAQKSATTRLKNRVKAGACPCCSKRFSDLAAHMAEKHPTYAEQKQ